jgi:hypothetical protein
VLIVDIGGRTVNLALFNNGEYRSGATLELGVEAALDNLDKSLIGRAGRALTLAERSELLSALLKEQRYDHTVDGAAWRLDSEAHLIFEATAAALIQEMRAKAPVDTAQRIVLIGGGAYPAFFGAAIKRALPLAQIASMPELANAYAAMGAKKARKK